MSPGSRYAIADEVVARHATRLDTSHSALNAALDRFATSLADLPRAWQGASFASFEEVRVRWQTAGAELNRALDDIRSRVATSAAVYDAGEADQAQAFRQLDRSVNWSGGSVRS